MAEVMRIQSQESYATPDALEMEIMEVSSRLVATTLGSIQDELKQELATAKDNKKNEAARNPRSSSVHLPPRRAFTTSDYLLPTAPATPSDNSSSPDSYFQLATAAPAAKATSPYYYYPISPPLSPPLVTSATSSSSSLSSTTMAPPLRSFSVMDYEPIPFTHKPGTALRLCDLPAELHYALFEFLDPIDAVCLALTSRRFYAVHWRARGRVSLAVRREGPNDMEWVWRHAGPFLLKKNNGKTENGNGKGAATAVGQNSLALLSPRGQVYCRKCRTSRCELHKHIREWMVNSSGGGSRLEEYCAVTEKFGPKAQEDARSFCYRSSPKHPNRCGRHTRNQRAVRLV